MATKTLITHIDDIDGTTEDVSEVQFSINGTQYVLDLSKKNQEALFKALEPYTSAARKVGSKRGSSPRSSNREQVAEMKKWLAANGYEVPARGRISKTLIEAYETKTPAAKSEPKAQEKSTTPEQKKDDKPAALKPEQKKDDKPKATAAVFSG